MVSLVLGVPLAGVAMKGKAERSDQELINAVHRFVRALGRRAASADPEVLAKMKTLRYDLEEAILDGVRGQRAAGVTWQQIGEAMGTTRQAAIMRWGPRLATAGRASKR